MTIIIRLAGTGGHVLLVDVMHACIYGSCVGGYMHRRKKKQQVAILLGGL